MKKKLLSLLMVTALTASLVAGCGSNGDSKDKSSGSDRETKVNETEMRNLNEIVTMYLDYAERQARRGNVMYMADWVKRLDAFLQFNEEDILHDKGKVTAAIAKAFAEKEFEKFRVLQDRTYQSDFDRLVAETSDDLTE